jgi:hypothetical protein
MSDGGHQTAQRWEVVVRFRMPRRAYPSFKKIATRFGIDVVTAQQILRRGE